MTHSTPAGPVATTIQNSVKTYFNFVKTYLAAGYPMVAGSIGDPSDDKLLDAGNWHRASHILAIKSVEFDAAGAPRKLTLYNPYGEDEVLTDMVKLYWLVSSARALRFH